MSVFAKMVEFYSQIENFEELPLSDYSPDFEKKSSIRIGKKIRI